MTLVGEVSYLRRFAGKFIEVVAAGIGTAVSGYLIAYLAGHFSLFTSPAVDPSPPQAISSTAQPHDNTSIEAKTSIEARVRAALASHDVSQADPMVAALQPSAPALPEVQALPAAVALPLASSEIRSLPVAAAAELPLPAEPNTWPSNPVPVSGSDRLLTTGSLRMLPPQPPPANPNLLAALKHFF